MWLVRGLLTILLWPIALVAMRLYAHFGNYDRVVIHPFMFLGPAKFLSDCELAVQLLKPYLRVEGRARPFSRKLRIWFSGNEIHKFQYFGMYSVSHAVCAHGEYGIASYLYYYLRLEFHIAVPWRISFRRRAAMDADLAARAETLVWLESHNFPQELKDVFSTEHVGSERGQL